MAQELSAAEPRLPPASSDFVSTTVASIENTPLFHIAYRSLVDAMSRYKDMREAGDCSAQITQDLKDAKAMADSARVNEWNSFTRLQKDYVDYARSHSDVSIHFRDRIRTPEEIRDIAAAQIFIMHDRDYPLQLVFYQLFSQADPLYCHPDGTSKKAPAP